MPVWFKGKTFKFLLSNNVGICLFRKKEKSSLENNDCSHLKGQFNLVNSR